MSGTAAQNLKLPFEAGWKAGLREYRKAILLYFEILCANAAVLGLFYLALHSDFSPSDTAPATPDSGSTAALAGLGLIPLIIFAAMYVYVSLALQTIATKTNTANPWLAWIPILNIFLMLTIAKKPLWWFILFLIPVVNFVMAILTWMAIAERRGKPSWWGIMLIVPVINLIAPGYIAWSD